MTSERTELITSNTWFRRSIFLPPEFFSSLRNNVIISLLPPSERQLRKVPEKVLLAQYVGTLAGVCFGDRIFTPFWSQHVVFLAVNTWCSDVYLDQDSLFWDTTYISAYDLRNWIIHVPQASQHRLGFRIHACFASPWFSPRFYSKPFRNQALLTSSLSRKAMSMKTLSMKCIPGNDMLLGTVGLPPHGDKL